MILGNNPTEQIIDWLKIHEKGLISQQFLANCKRFHHFWRNNSSIPPKDTFLMIFKHCDIIEQVCIFFRLLKKKLSKLKCIVFEKTNDK